MNKITIAAPFMGTDLFRKYMMGKYTKSIERAGGILCWIPVDDPREAAKAASACDGLLLTGGADIDPALYSCPREAACGKPNPLRDAAEPLMLQEFIRAQKPILCICRGIQMLNTVQGGTLQQDIKDTQQYRHADFLSRAKSTHPVAIDPTSALFRVFQSADIPVNSIHHQAIATLGKDLAATASSPDGFIEAVELADHPFCIGVQWHPEHMSKKSAMQRKLFTAFIEACCAKKRDCHATE